MAKSMIWLTYAWDDNKCGDVDFVAQELSAAVTVKLDRWNLSAGKRLWEQIAGFIQYPQESDAWLIYATQTSLGSEPCREEFAYALDRALYSRGENYPIIALFPGPVDRCLIPAGIRTRLFVSLTDPDWKERIIAAAEGRSPQVSHQQRQAYHVQIHPYEGPPSNSKWVIELRPRAGTWSPAFVVIPIDERDTVAPEIWRGAAGRVPRASSMNKGEGTANKGQLYLLHACDEITPTQSLYVFCKSLPSRLGFGVYEGTPQYTITPDQSQP
jgi:TIR domain